MERRSLLRASDADREIVAQRLREAALEGRLEPHELDDRLGRALAARTYGELDRLVGDLPAPLPARVPERSRLASRAAILLTVSLMLAALAVAYAPRFGTEERAIAFPHGHQQQVLIGHETISLAAPFVGLFGVVALCAGVCWLLSDHRPPSGA